MADRDELEVFVVIQLAKATNLKGWLVGGILVDTGVLLTCDEVWVNRQRNFLFRRVRRPVPSIFTP